MCALALTWSRNLQKEWEEEKTGKKELRNCADLIGYWQGEGAYITELGTTFL